MITMQRILTGLVVDEQLRRHSFWTETAEMGRSAQLEEAALFFFLEDPIV